jgi:hypothetical protein
MSAETENQTERPIKCVVRDRLFVEPCFGLSDLVDIPHSAFSRGKGVARWAYTNLETCAPSRTFFGIKTKQHPKGMLFNFCPICGENISAPFMDRES